MSIRTLLSKGAVDFVRGCHEPPAIDEIIDHLMQEYRADLDEEIDRAMRELVRSAAKAGLSSDQVMHDDNDQPSLPGFNVPVTISVPVSEGRVVYVAFENATRDQAYAHVAMKEANISRAVEERRAYGELLQSLDTVWTSEPDLTAGECIERLRS